MVYNGDMKKFGAHLILFLFSAFTVVLIGRELQPAEPANRADRNPVYNETIEADQAKALHLLDDGTQTIGWITGADMAGKRARIEQGDQTKKVKIAADNTFIWQHPPGTNLIKVVVGDLREQITPRVHDSLNTCVYFVVDRNLYRPQQEMQFAGFVRKLGPEQGDGARFEPVAATNLTVELRTATKGNLAASFEVHTDPVGRFVARYRFTEGDALDDYILTAPGLQGDARFRLGEFRKPKVRLEIDARREGDTLKVAFRTKDFSKEKVAAGACTFTVQIVAAQNATTSGGGLDASEFAAKKTDIGSSLNAMSTEQRLLLKHGVFSGQSGSRVLHNQSASLELGAEGEAEWTLELKPAWRHLANVEARISGVVIDGNGREQRGSASVSIAEETPSDDPVTAAKTTEQTDQSGIPLSRSVYAPGETVEFELPIPAGHSGVLVVTQLAAGKSLASRPYGNLNPHANWPQQISGQLIRELHTAIPIQADGPTRFTLPDPGVYQLNAVFRNQQTGRETRRQETISIDAALLALDLRLDRLVWEPGATLTGVLQSRFEDARVLVTLEGASGVKYHHQVTTLGGVAELHIPLPKDVSYGAVVTARMVDGEDRHHVSSRRVHVVQSERELTITSSVPESKGPGEDVELAFEVNRKEAVDLVVSVYDHSLHAVATDHSRNPMNFFLADERAFADTGNAIVRAALGDLTVGEALLAVQTKDIDPLNGADVLKWNGANQTLPKRWRTTWESEVKNQHLSAWMVPSLLQANGLPVITTVSYHSWRERFDKDERLADVLLRNHHNRYRLQFGLLDDVIVMAAVYGDQVWNPSHYGYGYGGWGNQWGGNQWSGFSGGGIVNGGTFALGGNMDISGNSFFAGGNGLMSMNSAMPVSGQSLMSYSGVMPGASPMPGAIDLAGGSTEDGLASIRRDFSDSAFFKGDVRTDENGRATVSFELPDSLTHWRVAVVGITPGLHVGRHEASFKTVKPIMVWPMPARAFTVGDEVDIFAIVHNRSDKAQSMAVKCDVNNGEIKGATEHTVELEPGGSTRVAWRYAPAFPGMTEVLMSTACDAGSDASLKVIPVNDNRAEEAISLSGLASGEHVLVIPKDVDLRHAELELKFSPSLVGDLDDTLNFLLQYPHGCVEQTMSRFLPTLRVAELIEHQGLSRPQLTEKIPSYAEAGVKRLIELQKSDGGWGWIGNGNTHELMTPYAMIGLIEAQRLGYDFDQQNAIERGTQRLRSYIRHQLSGSNQHADRVYCMHVYNMVRELEKDHWTWLEQRLESNEMSDYALALTLEMAVLRGRDKMAKDAAKQLRAGARRVAGKTHWTTANFSRWGNDPNEITAAAFKALVAYDASDPLLGEALAWLHSRKRGNRWNSTKDTAMIVYALCDFIGKQDAADGAASVSFQVSDNGKRSKKHTITFTNAFTHLVSIPVRNLKHGDNPIRFVAEDGAADPAGPVLFRATLRHWKTGTKIHASEHGLKVTRTFDLVDPKTKKMTRLDSGATVPLGHYLRMVVKVQAKDHPRLRYCLVAAPKPCGHETLPENDVRFGSSRTANYALREDRTSTVFWHHEEGYNQITDTAFLHPELTGSFVVPPAWSELMYETEVRGHSDSFTFTVADPD